MRLANIQATWTLVNTALDGCVNPESNVDFVTCQTYYTSVYTDCLSDCVNNAGCASDCSRRFDQNMIECPCAPNCPGGCPCPVYTCPSTRILTIWGVSNTTAILTRSNDGLVTDVRWGNEGDVSGLSLCSIKHENDFYILGLVGF